MPRGDEHSDNGGIRQRCPIELSAAILCQKWTVLIIRDLIPGPRYFSELRSSVSGISPRMLCGRLNELQEHELVSRRYIKGLPPRTEYSLTSHGQSLVRVLDELERFGRELIDRSLAPPAEPGCDEEAGAPATQATDWSPSAIEP